MKNLADGATARMMVPPEVFEAGPVTVTIDKADAIGVGMSLQAMARLGRPNPETAEQLGRVGDQLVRAARGKPSP